MASQNEKNILLVDVRAVAVTLAEKMLPQPHAG